MPSLKSPDLKKGLYVAIDAGSRSAAQDMARTLSLAPAGIKLGLEFFVAEGPSGVAAVMQAARDDVRLFLDLKLHDIPNTVAGAVRSAASLSPHYLTVHAGGGRDMLRAAQDAAPDGLTLLAVTVLTSLSANDLHSAGVAGTVSDQVLRLADLAVSSGIRGVVCSPHEIAGLRQRFGRDLRLVVPGIRPAGSAADDQKRVMTPQDAVAAGADDLVIGRPVTQSANPLAAVQAVIESI